MNIRFSLNDQQKQQVLTVCIHALVWVIVTLTPEVFMKWNYGSLAVVITPFLTMFSFFGHQYLSGKPAKQIALEVENQALNTTNAELLQKLKDAEDKLASNTTPNTP